MKLTLLLLGLAFSASAQTVPFVFRTELKTNAANIPAQGIIAAHVVSQVLEVAYVAIVTEKGVTPFEQPAVRILSTTTNLASEVIKPLLSAQPPSVSPKSAGNTNSPAWRRAHKLPPLK